MSNRGKLVVFEGADKTGKSHLAQAVVQWLTNRGVETLLLGFPGNEPGTVGKLVYEVHHHPEHLGIRTIHPLSIQILHLAAHVDAIERTILPALRSGVWVVLDRFWWSTLAYGLATDVDRQSLELLIEVERVRWAGVLPAVLFLILRDTPLGDEQSHESFLRLSRFYRVLADEEVHRYPVRVLENDRIADALCIILEELQSFSSRRT